MCGLAGVVALDGGPPDVAGVRAMTQALAHRGPDGSGSFADGPAAFGHRRLSIVDLTDAGRQPMTDRSGRFTLVYNGEIYNHVELRRALESEGVTFRSRCDTEVLVEGYARRGEAILGALNGMFAFAIWDAKERELFAARDRFGEKPFYYRFVPGREFRFASEIKALAPPGAGAARPREEALFRFLAYGHAGAERGTFFEGIEQLPAAHSLRVRDGGLACRRYWSLPEPPVTLVPPDAVERVAALFSDSVTLRLRSDVPVGTSLSGGIDSSAVAASVARALRSGQGGGVGTRQASFSSCLPGTPEDETGWIDVIGREMAVESHRVEPTGEGFLHDLPRLVEAQEEPFGGPSIYAQWKVMHLAKEAGVTVLLDGQGADEVFAGYHFFFQDYWWSLLRSGAIARLRAEMRRYDRAHGGGRARRLLVASLRARSPRLIRLARGGPRVPWLTVDFARRGGDAIPSSPPDLRRSLRDSQSRRMLPHLLRHADRNSMAASREVRLPFLDHRLVEAVDALPDDMKLRGGTTKWVLREAITGLIPESIRTRTDKIGFAVPTLRWLRGPCAAALRDTLLSQRTVERGILDTERIERDLDRFQEGDDRPAQILWNCWMTELWLRAFIDGETLRG
jgi:asparagine synthase (glutamine-hydrolysing)